MKPELAEYEAERNCKVLYVELNAPGTGTIKALRKT
jgi:hypothetical protein